MPQRLHLAFGGVFGGAFVDPAKTVAKAPKPYLRAGAFAAPSSKNLG